MTNFVICDQALLRVVLERCRRQAHRDPLQGIADGLVVDALTLTAGRKDGGLIEQVGQLSAREAGVRLAQSARDTSGSRGRERAWTARIASRPRRSGRSTWIWRSNRPGRIRAASRTSGRFVAASRITPEFSAKPSISVGVGSGSARAHRYRPRSPRRAGGRLHRSRQ